MWGVAMGRGRDGVSGRGRGGRGNGWRSGGVEDGREGGREGLFGFVLARCLLVLVGLTQKYYYPLLRGVGLMGLKSIAMALLFDD